MKMQCVLGRKTKPERSSSGSSSSTTTTRHQSSVGLPRLVACGPLPGVSAADFLVRRGASACFLCFRLTSFYAMIRVLMHRSSQSQTKPEVDARMATMANTDAEEQQTVGRQAPPRASGGCNHQMREWKRRYSAWMMLMLRTAGPGPFRPAPPRQQRSMNDPLLKCCVALECP